MRCSAKKNPTPATRIENARDVRIPGATQFDIRSAQGSDYRIFVWVPAGEAPAAGFPVLYALDGNATFGTAVEAVSMQMRRPEVTGVWPTMIVAIGYPTDQPLSSERRQYDYTPPARTDGAPGSGGAEIFLDFLESELKPLIDAEFPVNSQAQTLFGHSLGGLLTLYALFTRPATFSRYVAASPSIWWDSHRILDWEQGFIGGTAASSDQRHLLLTVGGDENRPTPRRTDRDAPAKSRMVDDVMALSGHLTAAALPSLKVLFHSFDGENHASVVAPTVGRAVRVAGAAL